MTVMFASTIEGESTQIEREVTLVLNESQDIVIESGLTYSVRYYKDDEGVLKLNLEINGEDFGEIFLKAEEERPLGMQGLVEAEPYAIFAFGSYHVTNNELKLVLKKPTKLESTSSKTTKIA